MNSKWEIISINDLKASRNGSIAIGPFGSRLKSDCYVSEGVRVIRGTNLMGGRELSGEFVCITDEKAAELGNSNVLENDLVFPHRGSIGEVGIVPNDGNKYVLSSSLMKLSCDTKKADPVFIYYFFKSTEGRHELLKNASQVGTPGIGQPLTSLKSIKLRLPKIEIQRFVADILTRIDDRIALLRETNATLEAIAQALFKSWFVDFDPVRAKQEGREPEGMDADTAALFPDSFEESELGLIPKGWSYRSFQDAVSIFDSKRIPLSGQDRANRQGQYPYYGAAAQMDSIDDFLFDGVYFLMGEDGSVADPDGYPITQYVWGKFWVNNHAHILQGKNGICTEQVMLFAKRTSVQPYITGAVQAKLSQSNMWRIPFLMPPKAVSESFGELIDSLFKSFRYNSDKVQTLASIRDTLLPRLISGQLRLPEAEAIIEEATA